MDKLRDLNVARKKLDVGQDPAYQSLRCLKWPETAWLGAAQTGGSLRGGCVAFRVVGEL